MATTPSVSDLLDQLVDAYNREDADGVVGMFAPDGVFLTPDGGALHGHDAIAEFHRDRFTNSPGSWFEVDGVAINGLTATATWRRHRAPDGADGLHDSYRGVDVITFDPDGLIRIKNTYAKATTPFVERVS